jgi:hypothetical protein
LFIFVYAFLNHKQTLLYFIPKQNYNENKHIIKLNSYIASNKSVYLDEVFGKRQEQQTMPKLWLTILQEPPVYE